MLELLGFWSCGEEKGIKDIPHLMKLIFSKLMTVEFDFHAEYFLSEIPSLRPS